MANEDKNQPETDKLKQLADDAAAAGRRALDSDTGRQIADLADAGFTKAGNMVDGLLDNPTGQQVKQGASELLDKAGPLGQSVAGRHIMAGAAVGLFVGLIFSFIGLFWGAVLGAGLGFLRAITKRP